MNRFLASAATVSLCAVLATPAGSARAADAPDGTANASANLSSANLGEELAKAKALRQQGKYDEASRMLGQLMLYAPGDGDVVGEYGKLLTQQGRSKDAIAFLKQAIELQASDWSLYSALGVAYDQVDDRADARISYEHALSLKPGDVSVLNNLAVSRMLAGDFDGAQHSLDQAAATGGGDTKIANNLQLLAQMKTAHGGVAVASATPHASAPTTPKSVASAPPRAIPAQAPAAMVIASAPPKALPGAEAHASPRPSAVAMMETQKTAPGGVMMQKVPVDPLAGPVHRANAAPRALVAKANPSVAAKPEPTPTVVAAAQKPMSGDVVMQQVPIDPLAGPVRKTVVTPHKPAKAVLAANKPKPSPAAKSTVALNAPPQLRASADDLRSDPTRR